MDHANDAVKQMTKFVITNTNTVSLLGAESMVLGKFFDASHRDRRDIQAGHQGCQADDG
jgi:hypothetical protein